MVKFKVIPTELEDAKRMIRDFLEQIKLNEDDTLLYRSLNLTEDPTQFIHFMSFKDEYARDFHQRSAHCREFVDQLYPICEEEPEFTSLNGVAFHN